MGNGSYVLLLLVFTTGVLSTSAAPGKTFRYPGHVAPMGFLGWNYFQCRTAINDPSPNVLSYVNVMKIADKMIELHLTSAGYTIMWVDDCWWSRKLHYDSQNGQGDPVTPENRFDTDERFDVSKHQGMPDLSNALHSRGMRFGLYADIGKRTCAGYPGMKDNIITDLKKYVSWRMDDFKVDGCNENFSEMAQHYADLSIALEAARNEYNQEVANTVPAEDLNAQKEQYAQEKSLQERRRLRRLKFQFEIDRCNARVTSLTAQLAKANTSNRRSLEEYQDKLREQVSSLRQFDGSMLKSGGRLTEDRQNFLKGVNVRRNKWMNMIREALRKEGRRESSESQLLNEIQSLNKRAARYRELIAKDKRMTERADSAKLAKAKAKEQQGQFPADTKVFGPLEPIALSCSMPAYHKHQSAIEREDMNFLRQYCSSWRNYNDDSASWSVIANIIDFWTAPERTEEFYTIPSAGPPEDRGKRVNDPDMLLTGFDELTLEQQWTQMSMWVLFHAPLLISGDVNKFTLDGPHVKILTNPDVLRVFKDAEHLQGRRIWRNGQVKVYAKEMSNSCKYMVAVNFGESKAGMKMNLYKMFNLNQNQKFKEIYKPMDFPVFVKPVHYTVDNAKEIEVTDTDEFTATMAALGDSNSYIIRPNTTESCFLTQIEKQINVVTPDEQAELKSGDSDEPIEQDA